MPTPEMATMTERELTLHHIGWIEKSAAYITRVGLHYDSARLREAAQEMRRMYAILYQDHEQEVVAT